MIAVAQCNCEYGLFIQWLTSLNVTKHHIKLTWYLLDLLSFIFQTINVDIMSSIMYLEFRETQGLTFQ